MKDFLLLIVGGLVLVAVFGDGGLTFSPDLSPALDAQLNVQYAPDRSVTTIEQQTNIDTNIERQQTTVIYQAAPAGANPAPGVNLVDVGPGRCATQPGDVIEQEQGNGACFVWNGDRKFFINPNGNRWEVDATGPTHQALGVQTPPAATSSTTVVTTTVLLAPDVPRTLPEFQAAFLRNGGTLPFFWNLRSDESKIQWLTQQGETWK
jgi:hypothetical protein